jgi:hypothetical protein
MEGIFEEKKDGDESLIEEVKVREVNDDYMDTLG